MGVVALRFQGQSTAWMEGGKWVRSVRGWRGWGNNFALVVSGPTVGRHEREENENVDPVHLLPYAVKM